jgi:signal transduction histidine kinase
MDPIDARRRKLLNILLLGVGVLCVLIVLLTLVADVLDSTGSQQEIQPIFIIGTGFLLATIGLYALNRYRSGWLASLLFLILWTLVLPFSDVPLEVAAGRSLFVFTIPIVMASVLLRPFSSFLFAALSSVEITALAVSIGEFPNIPAILGFFLIALVSWLSARSLENALAELIKVNQELDRRVIERTQALSESLARERAEAGRNQAILQDIADGVIVFDRSGRAIVANSAMVALAGSPVETILGVDVTKWLATSSLADTEREKLHRFFSSPASIADKPKIQWGQKTLAVTVAPVHTSGGEMIGQVAVFHDFTREAEIDRIKSDFVAMVSHELRTPLNSILGYADMLHEGVYGKMENRQAGVIERVMANTNKLLVIVNDLLDQAQIEAGRLSLHNRHFRPVELLEHVRQVMEGIAREKKVGLATSCAEDLPGLLYGDPQRLNQILVNLVNNALKFTDKGRVDVRLYRRGEGQWAIEVSDTGIGIPEEVQTAIFEPFRQVDMDLTRRPGGIGLGLSIVKQMVTLMRGEICLKSQVGQGSTFTVLLPIKAMEEESVINE